MQGREKKCSKGGGNIPQKQKGGRKTFELPHWSLKKSEGTEKKKNNEGRSSSDHRRREPRKDAKGFLEHDGQLDGGGGKKIIKKN